MPTQQEIIIAGAVEAGHCFSGTADAASGLSSLVDPVLEDSGVGTDFLAGDFILRFEAAAAGDRQRRMGANPFTVASGAMAPARAWTNVPDGETYHVFSLGPAIAQAGLPYSWAQALNAFLTHPDTLYLDRILVARELDGSGRFRLTQGENVMIAVIAVEGGSGATITAPAGWNLIRSTDNSTDLKVASYWRRYRSGDAVNFTWTFDTSRAATGTIVVLSDVNVAAPVNVSSEGTETSGLAPTVPTATTTVADCYVLRVAASPTPSTFEVPDDHAEVYDALAERPATSVALVVAGALASDAGATGTEDMTALTAIAATMQTIAIAPRVTTREVRPIDATGGDNGTGATTLVIDRPSAVPNDDWRATEGDVVGCYLRSLVSGQIIDDDANRNGNDYRVYTEGGELMLELLRAPTSEQDVVIEVSRPYAPLVNLSDVTPCPLNIAEAGMRWQMFAYLNRQSATRGTFKAEHDDAYTEFKKRYRRPAIRIKR